MIRIYSLKVWFFLSLMVIGNLSVAHAQDRSMEVRRAEWLHTLERSKKYMSSMTYFFLFNRQAEPSAGYLEEMPSMPAPLLKVYPGPGTNVVVNDTTDGFGPGRGKVQSEPSIAIDGQNMLVGFNDADGDSIPGTGRSGYAYSTNGGTSWTDGGTPPQGTEGLMGGDPAMTVDGEGNFFYANLYNIPKTLDEDSILVSALSVSHAVFNGGIVVWGDPVIAARTDTLVDLLDKEYLVADKQNGYLYMSYTRFLTDPSASGKGQIEVIRSTDGGLTWSSPVVLQPEEPNRVHQGSYPAVGPNGEVYIAWEQDWFDEYDGDGYSEIVVRKLASPSGWPNFGPKIEVARFVSNADTPPTGYSRTVVNEFPSVDVDKSGGPNNGHVYVVFVDADRDVRDVKLSKSTNGGLTWSAPDSVVRVNDDGAGADQFFPWVNVDPNGLVGVLWYDNRRLGGLYKDIFIDISEGGGKGEDTRVTEVATMWAPVWSCRPYQVCNLEFVNYGDYINLASDANTFHAVWGDGRIKTEHGPLGTPDVFYSTIYRKPSPPPNLQGWANGYLVYLEWDPSTPGAYPIDHYEIWRRYSLFDTFNQVGTTSTTYYFDSISPRKGGTYWYYVKAVDTGNIRSDPSDTVMVKVPGDGIPMVSGKALQVPEEYTLFPAYPNPFNPETMIRYGLPKAGHVRLVIYNLLGQEVRTLVDTFQPAGYHSAVWDSRNNQGQIVGSGIYLYKLTAGDFTETKRMILLK